jgi:hypothetical protein
MTVVGRRTTTFSVLISCAFIAVLALPSIPAVAEASFVGVWLSRADHGRYQVTAVDDGMYEIPIRCPAGYTVHLSGQGNHLEGRWPYTYTDNGNCQLSGEGRVVIDVASDGATVTVTHYRPLNDGECAGCVNLTDSWTRLSAPVTATPAAASSSSGGGEVSSSEPGSSNVDWILCVVGGVLVPCVAFLIVLWYRRRRKSAAVREDPAGDTRNETKVAAIDPDVDGGGPASSGAEPGSPTNV